MGSLFSTISGHFTKPIVVGALFPVAIFLAACYFLVLPLAPWELRSVTRLGELDAEWRLVALTVVAVVLAFPLYVLNGPLVRMYEGYPWAEGAIGTRMTTRRRSELNDAIDLRRELHALRRAYRAEAGAAADAAKLSALEAAERRMIDLQWNLHPRSGSVLPTRLGNVIRSFENYAERQYGFSAIALWPRFLSKIDTTYAAALDDVKSSFDFVLNLSFLSALLSLGLLLLGLAFPVPWISWTEAVQWVAAIGGTAAASWLLYLAAVNRAREWGTLVRGAFDLYRRPVLLALGVTDVPTDLAEERRLWREVSRQIAWGDRVEGEGRPLHFTTAGSVLSPATDALTLYRAVAPAAAPAGGAVAGGGGGGKRIMVRVINTGDRDIDGVTLTEKLTATRQLVWGSATLDGRPAEVDGVNPYTFRIGRVAAGANRELCYEVAEG
jgi:hypothetical protein